MQRNPTDDNATVSDAMLVVAFIVGTLALPVTPLAHFFLTAGSCWWGASRLNPRKRGTFEFALCAAGMGLFTSLVAHLALGDGPFAESATAWEVAEFNFLAMVYAAVLIVAEIIFVGLFVTTWKRARTRLHVLFTDCVSRNP